MAGIWNARLLEWGHFQLRLHPQLNRSFLLGTNPWMGGRDLTHLNQKGAYSKGGDDRQGRIT